jgi:hypothetical protein
MERHPDPGERGRLATAALAVALAAVSLSSFRRGKRLNGVLAGAGALAVGYNLASGSRDAMEPIEVETVDEDGGLRCAACGEPIRPGQLRGPNENDEIVHESCMGPSTER